MSWVCVVLVLVLRDFLQSLGFPLSSNTGISKLKLDLDKLALCAWYHWYTIKCIYSFFNSFNTHRCRGQWWTPNRLSAPAEWSWHATLDQSQCLLSAVSSTGLPTKKLSWLSQMQILQAKEHNSSCIVYNHLVVILSPKM